MSELEELSSEFGTIRRQDQLRLRESVRQQEQGEIPCQLYRIADAAEHIEALLSEAAGTASCEVRDAYPPVTQLT